MKKTKPENKKIVFSVRFTESLHSRLKRCAESDRRPMCDMLAILLTDALDARKSK